MKRNAIGTVVLLASLLFGASQAEESKFRLMGLCSADRVDDFKEFAKTMPDISLVSVDFDSTEVVLTYEFEKLFPGQNFKKKPPTPEAIEKRLNELLHNASRGSFTFKPLSTLAKDKEKVEEFNVGMLDCKGCRYGVYSAVSKVDGVERAQVNSEKGILKLWIDPAKTNRTALEEVLKKAHIELPGHEEETKKKK
ncbi:MAG: hypothetical protein WCT04_02200 [Planctomycetota bacterium]